MDWSTFWTIFAQVAIAFVPTLIIIAAVSHVTTGIIARWYVWAKISTTPKRTTRMFHS